MGVRERFIKAMIEKGWEELYCDCKMSNLIARLWKTDDRKEKLILIKNDKIMFIHDNYFVKNRMNEYGEFLDEDTTLYFKDEKVGVKFESESGNKIYSFRNDYDLDIKIGDKVECETVRGVKIGTVVRINDFSPVKVRKSILFIVDEKKITRKQRLLNDLKNRTTVRIDYATNSDNKASVIFSENEIYMLEIAIHCFYGDMLASKNSVIVDWQVF